MNAINFLSLGIRYVNEMTEFASCVRENRKPEITVYDGTAVNKVANRCKESFENKTVIA
ncbi:MAG: hypothetical protein ACLUU0_11155 [Anaerostipes hadrus]